MRRRHSRPSAGPDQNRIEAEPDHRDDHQVHRNDIVESSRREQDDRPHRDSDSSRAIFTRIIQCAPASIASAGLASLPGTARALARAASSFGGSRACV